MKYSHQVNLLYLSEKPTDSLGLFTLLDNFFAAGFLKQIFGPQSSSKYFTPLGYASVVSQYQWTFPQILDRMSSMKSAMDLHLDNYCVTIDASIAISSYCKIVGVLSMPHSLQQSH